MIAAGTEYDPSPEFEKGKLPASYLAIRHVRMGAPCQFHNPRIRQRIVVRYNPRQ